ncbi:unnamed protein product [Owenia fusiformis]|uniref:Uncharacterized protein n=1 Tax=Owenia fusiformis TaxID=6347 RepID=A0A8J1XJM7_OWEFU|nr:unnamed protein product [Owenia fusiformis]
MTYQTSFLKQLNRREILGSTNTEFQRESHVTPDLTLRIGLEKELEGHTGCVNCLEWNQSGSLLASGSDDMQVIVWEPLHHRKLTAIHTGHNGNIFSVKFLPNTNDGLVVTGAADCKIRVHDLKSKETTQVFSSHAGRVKRIAVAPTVPFMFWSASEDGTIMQFDLREPELSSGTSPRNVLVNLNAHMGSHAEAKCLAINPLRPELLAVGANDPYVRIYDRRMLACKMIQFPSERMYGNQAQTMSHMSPEDFDIPTTAVSYYVAGHLPQKQQDYKKRYRTLASTYLTFSPDGNELLVNLGGEQIYMFDINRRQLPQKFNMPRMPNTNGFVKEAAATQNGFTSSRNGTNGTTNGVSRHIQESTNGVLAHIDEPVKAKRYKYRSDKVLPPNVEVIKQQANSVFEHQNYTSAIMLYNRAIAMVSDSAILFGNRAAAYLKRAWDGDVYAALRDCYSAIRLDPTHLKAHFRLARCLYELAWTKEAHDCLAMFKEKFPDYAKSPACEALDKDITTDIAEQSDEKESAKKDTEESPSSSRQKKEVVSSQELAWQKMAFDYDSRFCGHCNTTTDIKEANFFGSNGQYIVAGSDDGSFFIWERKTTNIVRVLRGDDSIVNCLQPHPSYCILATSGIDPVVRLWTPQPINVLNDRIVDNSDDAASANQKRMNADPLEVMLMNMGYRYQGALDGEEEEGREGAVQCRPS